jgi:hypothetical protein
MNSGNVSGQYVELQRAVLGKLPRDFDWVDLDYLTKNTEVLGIFLEKMRKIIPAGFDFEVEVLYGEDIEVAMKIAKVCNTCPSVSSEYLRPFGSVRTEKIRIVTSRYSGDDCVETVGLVLSTYPFRHANLWEVISLSGLPIANHACIVALGSPIFLGNNSSPYVPFTYPSPHGGIEVSMLPVNSIRKRKRMFFAGVRVD